MRDRSKNAALIPPAFGSASAYTLNTGTPLTPNLAPGYQPVTGAVVNGGAAAVVTPGTIIPSAGGSSTVQTSSGFTEVTKDLYYSGGYLATLKIPAVGLSVRVYQGTDSKTLAKGVGHFEETSIWDGNVALAAHNRGTNDYFGEIHTLDIGDRITLTTRLGTPDVPGNLGGEDQRDGSERSGPLRGEPADPVHLRPGSAGVPLVRPGGGGVMDNLPYAAPPSSVVWSIAFPSSLEYRVAEARRICR